MDRVVTVHGIWTEGRWQEEIAPVLYPHFEPTSVKYRSYRFLGPLDLLFEPWVLLPGVMAWALTVAWLSRGPLHLRAWVLLGMAWLAIAIGANLLAPWRLKRTARHFLRKTAVSVLFGRFHLIAHSLGSYIVCTALRDEDPLFTGRIVLAGCVVDRRFAWRAVAAHAKFVAIRNEVAGRDLVAWAAQLLRWRVRDFGAAGRYGFAEAMDLVHTVPNPNLRCAIAPDPAIVHNYISKDKDHSGVLNARYAKYYWLPFFWGIDPPEFREFLDACGGMLRAIARAGSPDAPPPGGEFDTLAAQFLARRWEWTGGMTIQGYLIAAGRPVAAAGDLKIIAFNTCFAVAQAESELEAKLETWRRDPISRRTFKSLDHDEAIKALYPPTAIARAYVAYKAR